MRELWDYVGRVENFWTTLTEIEQGSVARLAELTATHKWEVLFLTQRPPTAGATSQVQSQRWLKKHGFDMPSVFVMKGSRGKVAAALNLHAVLDDRAENCLDVATESKARPLLIWRHDPANIPPGARRLGIEPLLSFGNALDELLQMTTASRRKPGAMDRLRNAIGI
jgi:hypothetical protein